MYHFLQKLISSLRPSSTNANLLQRVPPFVFYLFYVTHKIGRLQRVPPFFFLALCEFFFRKVLMSQKNPPSDFLVFCNRKCVNESQRVPLFTFRHYATFSKFFSKRFQKVFFQKKFSNFFCFQSGKAIFQS